MAFHADFPRLAAHELDQTLDDGQAQARAAEFPGHGTIGLREGREEDGLDFRRHADAGVSDLETQARTPFWQAVLESHADRNLARAGELDGIANQVE